MYRLRSGSLEYVSIISSYPSKNALGPSAICINFFHKSLAVLPKVFFRPILCDETSTGQWSVHVFWVYIRLNNFINNDTHSIVRAESSIRATLRLSLTIAANRLG